MLCGSVIKSTYIVLMWKPKTDLTKTANSVLVWTAGGKCAYSGVDVRVKFFSSTLRSQLIRPKMEKSSSSKLFRNMEANTKKTR